MRFGIFYEHQLPRPWAPGDEHRLLKDALEQVELADRLGFDYCWEVEHHYLEEYSHSSAPEVFLAAASQRTSRIRLGHGIVQLPPGYNHPARVAERIATLDLVSDGRVEFGTGESSSETELGGFGIARQDKRAQWDEALDVVTRMLVEEPFAGHHGKFIDVPPRNLVPKPLQKPHPPLWVACSRRETIHLAASRPTTAATSSRSGSTRRGRPARPRPDRKRVLATLWGALGEVVVRGAVRHNDPDAAAKLEGIHAGSAPPPGGWKWQARWRVDPVGACVRCGQPANTEGPVESVRVV